MKRVTTILMTALLASSLLTAAEARGGRGGGGFHGGGHIASFGGGARIGGIGFGENQMGRGHHSLSLHQYTMHRVGRYSPGYGFYDSYDGNCHIEATWADEFPCSPR